MTEKKIAIIGTAYSTVEKAPYDDKSWQIWNMGANYVRKKRFDRWFEVHSFELLSASDAHVSYLEFMKECGPKLISGHPHELIPEATPYPLDTIVQTYGDYFTCSAAWMIALAIHEGATEIGLWGIDMSVESEYGYQKPCVEHWLGYAKGKGICVSLPPDSPILRSGCLYGFESLKFSGELTRKIREYDKEIEKLKPAAVEAQQKIIKLEAKREVLAEFGHRWGI